MTPSDLIPTHTPGAGLVAMRVGGLMLFAPIFASIAIPVRLRLLLTAAIALAAYPALLASGVFADLPAEPVRLAPLLGTELLIGAIMGFAASVPVIGIQGGGVLMGQQMGLGFARIVDPALRNDSDALGRLLVVLALMSYLAVGGHEQALLAILNSFEHVPPGSNLIDSGGLDLAAGLLLSAFELALRIAAPLLAVVFVETIAVGFVARTVPGLNILSLGFPLRLLVGIGLLLLGLTVIREVFIESFADTMDVLVRWTERAV